MYIFPSSQLIHKKSIIPNTTKLSKYLKMLLRIKSPKNIENSPKSIILTEREAVLKKYQLGYSVQRNFRSV